MCFIWGKKEKRITQFPEQTWEKKVHKQTNKQTLNAYEIVGLKIARNLLQVMNNLYGKIAHDARNIVAPFDF